ncbi:MAG: hypothetical protein ABSA51_05615 [Anaerolineaceae bacterium]|jgi:ElaB/YqjD/DUF883 family membrane-anchored ribosome-binding protein
MNGQQLDNKVRQDAAKVKKDLSTLIGDGTARFNRFEENVSQAPGKAKEDLTTWVEGGVTQLGEGFEMLTDNARETVAGAAATVKKEVGNGLSQYNARVQEAADRVPGNLGKNAVKYPWVAISIALMVGLLLSGLLFTQTHRRIS